MNVIWPTKTREIHNHSINSEIWNDFKFRDDDVVVATWAKSGTTWVQQIITQLIHNGQPGLPVAEMSPWVDLRIPAAKIKLEMIESLEHRRVLKTHLPVDALVYSRDAKYVYVGRDGRDVVWSLYNHHVNANDVWYDKLNNTPGRVGPPIVRPPDTVSEYFDQWLEGDGYPMWSFWDNIRSWWSVRELENLHILHFESLLKNRAAETRRLAEFLGIPVDETKWDDILKHTSFEYMKRNATLSTPLGGIFWDKGAEVFINRGTNGRWCDVLTDEQVALYERTATKQLGKAAAKWLATGELP